MKYIKQIICPLILVVIAVAMGWSLNSESEVLYRIQELSLFLPTKLFFQTSTIYPGGVLTWAAAYMTQFFYHPGTGITLLILACMAIMALTTWIYRLRGPWMLLSALIPLALMACMVQTGYWIYYMKLQGYIWVPTLGVLLSLILQIPALYVKGWWRLIYIGLIGIIGYPVMGAWSFMALGLMALAHYEDADWKQNVSYIALVAFLVGIVPQVWYQWCYSQVEAREVYVACLPCYQFGQVNCTEFHRPYYALAFTLLIPSILNWVNQYKKKDWNKVVSYIIAVCLVCVGIYCTNKAWYKDTNFHKEVKMMNCMEQANWEGALAAMREQNVGDKMPPSRIMVMMKNLALFRLGRAGDEMFQYPEGSEQYCICGRHTIAQNIGTTDAPRDTTVHADGYSGHTVAPLRITQVGGKLVYYLVGKEQFCYRWCMEDGVEFGWNANVLKYMVKTSLLTHDWEVARKYLNLLKKTRYHREWAEKYEAYLYHPELMQKDDEMKVIIPMANFPDRLDGDMTLVEMYLLRTFSSGHGADQYYQEMTLICSMLMKDINLFWPRFLQYLNMHQKEPGFHLPRYYQEAAYLYSMLEPQRPSVLWPGMTNADALQRLPFDNSVKQKYQEFMDFNNQCGAMNDDQKKEAFYPMYGDTFYYFYFLMRNQKTN